MREIIIDTETISLDPLDGHRIVEIAAVQFVNRSLTGETPATRYASRHHRHGVQVLPRDHATEATE